MLIKEEREQATLPNPETPHLEWFSVKELRN